MTRETGLSAIGIAGRGLASALGPDLATACRRLRSGAPPPAIVTLADGSRRPLFRMATGDVDPSWHERARRLILAVTAEAGVGTTTRGGALLIASSSHDVGACDGAETAFGAHRFSQDVAQWLDWRGPVFSIDTACTSSLNALATGCRLLERSRTAEAVILGVELDNLLTPGGFSAMQLISHTRPRPFGVGRDGMVLGQAVAALHLTRDAARWQVRSVVNMVDGSDATMAVQTLVVTACRRALAEAGVTTQEIGLIKVQAAGSPGNDAVEAAALHELFSPLPPLVSLKGVIGHCLGAAGAAEIALLCAALESQSLPREATQSDPALAVGLVQAKVPAARFVLVLILGFGGGHAVAVLEDCASGAA